MRDEIMYSEKRHQSGDQKKGLYFANMGSIYDLPVNSRSDANTQAETVTDSSKMWQNSSQFQKTERAIRKKPFDTFYTDTITQDKTNPQQVNFT